MCANVCVCVICDNLYTNFFGKNLRRRFRFTARERREAKRIYYILFNFPVDKFARNRKFFCGTLQRREREKKKRERVGKNERRFFVEKKGDEAGG